MRPHLLAASLWLATALPVQAASGRVTVIVNKETPTSSVSREELARIYLGKKVLWESSKRILPAMLEESSPVSDAFLDETVHKTSSQFRAYWKRQLFSGGGAPPRTFRTSAQVADFVARQPGAIGVVEGGFVDDRVKVVQISE
jgi:ABC-type phosphate transport system substrate-binding protein